MSMMRKPEMEVIRFKEADVIVASGGGVPQTMTSSGWADGQDGNLKFIYDGNTYTYENRQDLLDLIIANGQTTNIYRISNGQTYNMSYLFDRDYKNDNGNHQFSEVTWDAANNRWFVQ